MSRPWQIASQKKFLQFAHDSLLLHCEQTETYLLLRCIFRLKEVIQLHVYEILLQHHLKDFLFYTTT